MDYPQEEPPAPTPRRETEPGWREDDFAAGDFDYWELDDEPPPEPGDFFLAPPDADDR